MDVQPYVASGRVVLPYGDKFNTEFVAEVASFTHDDSHKHDDQTDVMIDAIDIAFCAASIWHRRRLRKIKAPLASTQKRDMLRENIRA